MSSQVLILHQTKDYINFTYRPLFTNRSTTIAHTWWVSGYPHTLECAISFKLSLQLWLGPTRPQITNINTSNITTVSGHDGYNSNSFCLSSHVKNTRTELKDTGYAHVKARETCLAKYLKYRNKKEVVR